MLNDTSRHAILKGTVLAFFFLLLPVVTTAHNVDGNSQEGLAEAIHALQVAAGMAPDSSSPTGIAQPNQVLSGVTFSNENEIGLVGEYNGRTGTAQSGQVFAGVTFSNESGSDLVGAYHGPPGCVGQDNWDYVQCFNDCIFNRAHLGLVSWQGCMQDFCENLQFNSYYSDVKGVVQDLCM